MVVLLPRVTNYMREYGMTMNRLFLWAALVLSLTACDKYRIEGVSSVSSLDGKMLFVKVWEEGRMTTVDSCEIVHGKFSMSGKVDSVVMATLYMDDRPMMPLVIERGNIRIVIDDLKLAASGTKLNDKLSGFIERQKSISGRADDLSHRESQMIMDGKDPAEIQEMVDSEEEKLSKEMNQLVKDFITGNYDNALGAGVFMILCSNMPYPVMTPQMEELLDKAPESFRNHPFIKEFVTNAEENTRRMKYGRE